LKYYKIVNPEGHHGLIYREGLNIDPLPFNPSGDCEPGGIYFAKEDILAFMDYGTELYEVESIGDVYENPGKPKKYKAHEVNLKYIGKVIDNIEMLIKEGADIHADNDTVLYWAAKNGHYNVVKLLLENGTDIHANRDYALRLAANNGYYDVVKLLLENGANVHVNNDIALILAVNKRHYNVVKLLIEYGADIHANDYVELRLAAYNNDEKMIKLLESYITKK